MPTIPFLPSFLRRRPEPAALPAPEPWPGNPRTVADDLRESLAIEAELGRQLVSARQEADIEAARAAAFEQRAEAAEGQHAEVAAQLTAAHRELRNVAAECDGLRATTTAQRTEITGLRAANAGLSKQLHDAMYDDADRAAIESGTGQPRKS